MKQFTIGKRISITVAILCIALAGVGISAVTKLYSISAITHDLAEDSIPSITTLGRITTRMRENQLRYALMMSVKTPVERKDLNAGIDALRAANNEDFKRLEGTISGDADRRLFDTLQSARAANAATRTRFVELLETDSNAAKEFYFSTITPTFIAYSTAGDALSKFKADSGEASGIKVADEVTSSTRLLEIITTLAVIVGVLLSIFNIRAIIKVLNGISTSLNAGSQQTTAAASQVSSASEILAEGATEQASSLEETSASLEEISGMTKRNAENAQKAKALAGGARSAADVGVTDMASMQTAMDELKVSSDDIAKIIKTIDEIAFQTNILALNAAVEAARAGESGAGFAVVADEVRNLAQRAAQAAKETSGKIEGSITKTAQGVNICKKVADSLETIASRSRQVDELVVEIATASMEQDQGIKQVTAAVSQMDHVTQSNASTAEEIASSSEELNAQAMSMHEAVRELLALTGSKDADDSVSLSTRART